MSLVKVAVTLSRRVRNTLRNVVAQDVGFVKWKVAETLEKGLLLALSVCPIGTFLLKVSPLDLF